MKIYFNYNKYPNSDGATALSYFANLLLALDFMFVVPVVILAFALIVDEGLTSESFLVALAALACIGYIILYFVTMKSTHKNAEPKRYVEQAAQHLCARREVEQAAQHLCARWEQEAEIVKQLYPRFNMKEELQNSHFRYLLKSGVPVKQAYELIHKDEIQNTYAHTEET